MAEILDRGLYLFSVLIDFGLITFLFFWSKQWSNLISSNFIGGFLRFVLLYRVFAYGILPNTLRFLTNGSINNQDQYYTKAYEIFQVSALESLSNLIYFFFITFFLLVFRKKIKYRINEVSENRIVIVIAILGVVFTFFKDFFSTYLWLIATSVFRIAPALFAVLLHRGYQRNNKHFKLIGGFGILVFLVYTMSSGHRGMIVANMLLLLFLFWFHPVIKKTKILLLGVLIVIGFLAMQGPLKMIKQLTTAEKLARKEFTESYSFTEKVELFFEIQKRIESRPEPLYEKAKKIFDEIQFRYGASTMFGVGFLRMVNSGEVAGFKPIRNSFYSFVPRQIFGDNKPWPSSIDGTEEGMGMYRVVNVINPNYYFMTDFAVAGHYYWEFGLVGVIFFSIVPAFYITIIIRIVENAGLLGFGFFFVSIKSFQLLPKLWISEMITMIPTVILPMFILGILLIFLSKIRVKK